MKIRRQAPSVSVKIESLQYQVKVPNGEPRNILEKIVWHKEQEVEKLRNSRPLLELRRQVGALTEKPLDFVSALKESDNKPALIAEVKKASPSKGVIKENFDPVAIAQAYEEGGASCLSVLTDREFFQGGFENLQLVRKAVKLPLLCKEFVIYPYQIYLARLNGADAVLLIAAILKDSDLSYFLKIIHSLGMNALVEVHSLEELDRVLKIDGVKLIGVNNRNLEDFTVDLANTENLLSAREKELSEKDITVVSESGLYTKEDLQFVRSAGASAVLIGESIVKQDDIVSAVKNLY